MPESRYSIDEIGRRGDEIYDRSIRGEGEGAHDGEIVAIDVDTGLHALGDTCSSAAEPLFVKNPDAEIWFVRVGRRAVTRIGSWMNNPRDDYRHS
jgi:hypothetical protein